MKDTALFRISIDTVIVGFTAGAGAYLVKPDSKIAIIAGLVAAGKNLQSRLTPAPGQTP